MAQRPTDLQIKWLAHACRFGEYGKNARHPDRFGPLISCVGGRPEGYVTKVLGDPLRHFGSQPILTNGTLLTWCTGDFEPRIPPYCTRRTARLIRPQPAYEMDKKRRFVYEGATYVITCVGNPYIGYTAERCFLFYGQTGFDMERVIEKAWLFCWSKSKNPLPSKNPSVF